MTTYNKDFIVKNGLQVGGNTTITGSLTAAGLTYPNADGSADQYLKTDGSGNLSWGTVNVNNITGNLTVSGDITSGGKVLFANVYPNLSDLPSASTYHGMFAHVHATGKGYFAHAGAWVELANNSDLYSDADAISAVQGAANLTIDGGTIYVDTANDRVGIGDTSPQYKLDVAGDIAINGNVVLNSSGVYQTAITSGSLRGTLDDATVQYGTSYSGTPVQGSFFFDSLNSKLKVYTGSTFVDAVPAGSGGGGGGGSSDANATFEKYIYILSSATNVVSGADINTNTLTYTTGSNVDIEVFVNGVKQVQGASYDYVATTGTSVNFTYNVPSGSSVEVQVYELLTNDAYYLKTETYTQTEVNSQISTGVSSYLPLAGGTMTGRPVLNYNNPEIRFEDTDTSNNGEITLDNTSLRFESDPDNAVANSTIKFMVDGDTKAIIDDSGKVGIGTEDPQSSLNIAGNNTAVFAGSDALYNKDHNAFVKIENYSETNNVEAGIVLRAKGTGAGAHAMYVKHRGTGTTYQGDLRFRSRNTSTTSQDNMTITYDGKVGIGTTNPATKLHVEGGPLTLLDLGEADGVDIIHMGEGTNPNEFRLRGNFAGSGGTGNNIVFTSDLDSEKNIMFLRGDGRVSVGNLNNQAYGQFQVNQTSDNDEDGIGILNSTNVRSMRIYVNSDDRSVINSGNGGGGNLVLNEGGGQVNFGSNSNANNGHVQLSYGTTVSDPPTLTINATSQSTTAPGDVYGQIVFRVNGAAGVSASGLANTDEDSIAMITAQDWRDSSGKTNEDSGIGFYTSNSSGTLTFRGGFSNAGHFGIGTKNNDSALQRLLTLSDPDPSIHAIDTDNNATCDIIMQDGQMDYRADQASTQGSSAHIWRVDGSQVAYLNGDGMRFGNTSAGANALDDYEEGTFSVTLTDGTNSASKNFKYVKVGRCVNIQGPTGSTQYWVLIASGTGAGTNLSFTGNLPFTPADNGGIVSSAQRAIRQSNGTDFGTGVMPVLGWRDGSTTMYLDHTGREHGYAFANDCERDSTRTNIVMQFNGWYYTNS